MQSLSRRLIIALLWVSLVAGSLAAEPFAWVPPSTNGMRDLSSFLETHREKLELPALAAVVVRNDLVVSAGAVGERKTGSAATVSLNDRFHIGSCTKSMTALLAAALVREGKIQFNTPAAEVFPEWKLDGEKREITLEMLLRNRSGLGAQPN